MAVRGSSIAVSMMMARSESAASALGTSSTPLMFGMRMSESITCGCSAAWRSSASAPLAACSTRKPSRVRNRSSAWRMPSSSSTTSTVVGGLCGSGLGMALTYVPSTTRASRAILRAPMASSAPASLTAVRGISVGHWTDLERATGCSVVLGPESGMRAACAVRGRATGTRELDALNPRHVVDRIDAVLLTGGSAFGLGAADGVMRWLKERGRGLPVGSAGIVPIVPTAVIFDFDLAPGGKAERWPTADDAYRACTAASADVVEGSVGAGTGATVGKALGPRAAMKGGVGSWAASGGRIVAGAPGGLNAGGNILDGAGAGLAGGRAADGPFAGALAHFARRSEEHTSELQSQSN